MRWTHFAGRNFCATSGVCADGEVVWSWRSDAGVKLAKTLTRLADDGGNQAWSPGRSRISRKAIAQGRPDDPPVPVVLPRAFFCTRTMGAVGTRPSLRPLLFRGRLDRITRTHSCREIMDSRLSTRRPGLDPGPICGRPPWHKSFLRWDRIACIHMSGLLVRRV